MLPTLTALLCLETLPKPFIWASPMNRVTKGHSVNIWCQGTQSASEYHLYFEGSLVAMKKPKPSRSTSAVKFFISHMTSHTAGRYSCFYQSGELWSEFSNTLHLVMTGLYDTPNLWVHPGSAVAIGENVTFSCQLKSATNKFFLLKEGRSNHVQHRYGNTQAEFPMGPMTRAQIGTYTCFGSYNDYTWSFPSKSVHLFIAGDVDNTSFAPTDPTSSFDYLEFNLSTKESGLHTDSALWDHTTQNLVRIGLACIVLMALVCLLAEDWLSKKKDKEGTNILASRRCRKRWRVQRFPEE
ncbi:natural cytotoxicity triggering receptor 1-like isoform X1 [Meriones unguiculatus]|uniref:natural cytotoxicity triggering receptor 1-like isoform X1 n=2 Tax=Meriones unguiculatus TaxID=10047 RepID=UPI00293E1B94|nr:natural cytotoxicity triggering receptor 1-like isoform X1 [Meriones unguiculatus]